MTHIQIRNPHQVAIDVPGHGLLNAGDDAPQRPAVDDTPQGRETTTAATSGQTTTARRGRGGKRR